MSSKFHISLFTFAVSMAVSFSGQARDRINSAGLTLSKEVSMQSFKSAELALRKFAVSISNFDDLVLSADMDGVVYKPDVVETLRQIEVSGFFLDADASWMQTRGQSLLDNPQLILTARISDSQKLLGAISRSERLHAGLIAKAIMTDVYKNVHIRLIQTIDQ